MAVLFVTGNAHKLKAFEHILGMKLQQADLELDEIQGMEPLRIAEHKAREAYRKLGKPVFIADQSLSIACLNGFPGPLVKWFWKSAGTKVCTLAQLLGDNRISTQTTITFFDGKTLKHFTGIVEGTIPPKPRGNNGFDWDTIFIPKGHMRTYAEMSSEEKLGIVRISMEVDKIRQCLN